MWKFHTNTSSGTQVFSWSLGRHRSSWQTWRWCQMNGSILMNLLWGFHQEPTSSQYIQNYPFYREKVWPTNKQTVPLFIQILKVLKSLTDRQNILMFIDILLLIVSQNICVSESSNICVAEGKLLATNKQTNSNFIHIDDDAFDHVWH